MKSPPWLKSGLLATGCALAGYGTAARLMPPAAPAPAPLAATLHPARSPLGKPGGDAAAASVQGYLDSLLQAGTPARQAAAALAFAALTDPDEIRAMLDQARSFPAHSAGPLASQTLLKRWLELDPVAALEYSRIHFDTTLPKLLGSYAATHPAEAEAWILSLPGGKAKAEAWQELCATIATRDPGKAWNLLARSPPEPGFDGSGKVRSLVQKLTAQDLEGTMARLSTLPSMLLKAARDAISKQLTETDPVRGWEWACQQPNPNNLISNAIQITLKKDPAQALAWLATLPAAQRKRIMNEDGYNWGSRDSAALVAALSGSTGFNVPEKQELAGRLFINGSWLDPEGAEAFIPFLSETQLSGNLANYLKNRAHKTSAAETEAWIAGLPLGLLVRTAAEASWKEQQVPETPMDRSTPASLVSDFKKYGGVQGSDSRISQLNAAQLGEMMADQTGSKSHYYREILTSLAKTNPAPAAAWLASVPADAQTGPLGAQFSATWAQEDPVAAAAWVNSLPAGDLAVNAAANVARHYHRYAPLEAQTWLQTLPAGPVQDAARKGMEGK